MEIRRFFVEPKAINGNLVRVTGEEFLHMTKVLRYKLGYQAIVCCDDGKERLCTVRIIGKDFAELTIDDVKTVDSKRVKFTLFAGLLKNNKLDFTIQKCVELGVDEVIPFTSANTAETKFNAERGNKIVVESAKQCGSAYLTKIGEICTLDKVFSTFKKFDKVIFAYEGEKSHKIKDVDFGDCKKIALVVGAEGGFTPEEAETAAKKGAEVVTLGKRILRAETAGIVASALTLDALGELDYD